MQDDHPMNTPTLADCNPALQAEIAPLLSLQNAKDWAQPNAEQTALLCDLSGWSVNDPEFETRQAIVEGLWDEILTSQKQLDSQAN